MRWHRHGTAIIMVTQEQAGQRNPLDGQRAALANWGSAIPLHARRACQL